MAEPKASAVGFGKRLRSLREAAGLTQAQLGERAEMLPHAIGRLEQGQRAPGWDTLLRLADALGVSLDAFRPDPEPPPGPPARPMGKRK